MSRNQELSTPEQPRWLHYWAVLTVCATLGMLLLGAIVTTFKVGMADPVWPTAPWHLLLIDWQEPSAGFLIEHTHRAAGHVIGYCVIVLAVGLWLREPRLGLRRLGLGALASMIVTLALGFWLKETQFWLVCVAVTLADVGLLLVVALRLKEPAFWLRWLATAALGGVIVQGLLGGFRVKLNALVGTDLAVIHGCFAQVMFAVLVALALLTSRGWKLHGANPAEGSVRARLNTLSAVATSLILVQIILGALLRHNTQTALAQRGHLLVAFAVVIAVAWLAGVAFAGPVRDRSIARAVALLAALVGVQLFFGVEALFFRFSAGMLPELQSVTLPQALVRTIHVLLGSCILATSVVVTLRGRRRTNLTVQLAAAPTSRLEGAA